jgi:hypothetical protein
MWEMCGLTCESTYCTYLVGFTIHTQHMSVLEPIAKPNLAAAHVLCKVLWNLRTIDTVSTVNAGWIVLELILGLNGEKPLATCLSHGTARLTGENGEMTDTRVARTFIKTLKPGCWYTKMLLISYTITVHRWIWLVTFLAIYNDNVSHLLRSSKYV